MFEFLRQIFSMDFMPHVYSLRLAEVIWLHVVPDGVIVASYFLIPVAMIQLVRRQQNLAHSGMFLLFGLFILACGRTHRLDVFTLWYVFYRFDGIGKALTALVSLPPTAVYVKDLQGRLTMVNRETEILLGRRREQLIGLTDSQFLPPEVAHGILQNDRQVLPSGRSLTMEEHVPLADGLHTYMSVKFPLTDDKGRVYISASGARITDEKLPKVEADRRQLSGVLQQLLMNALAYHDGGPPQISVWARERGQEIEFVVRDNGICIAAPFHERIFGLFKRLHTQRKHPAMASAWRSARRFSSGMVAASGSSPHWAPDQPSTSL